MILPSKNYLKNAKTYSETEGISLDMIRRWLFDQEGESVVPRMYGACSGPGFTVDLPLKWMVDQTGKFWEGSEHLLLMTGNEGCGKSAICQFLLDQSRSRYPRGTRVLYFSFGKNTSQLAYRLGTGRIRIPMR